MIILGCEGWGVRTGCRKLRSEELHNPEHGSFRVIESKGVRGVGVVALMEKMRNSFT
jgi:hypothetical protein